MIPASSRNSEIRAECRPHGFTDDVISLNHKRWMHALQLVPTGIPDNVKSIPAEMLCCTMVRFTVQHCAGACLHALQNCVCTPYKNGGECMYMCMHES